MEFDLMNRYNRIAFLTIFDLCLFFNFSFKV